MGQKLKDERFSRAKASQKVVDAKDARKEATDQTEPPPPEEAEPLPSDKAEPLPPSEAEPIPSNEAEPIPSDEFLFKCFGNAEYC